MNLYTGALQAARAANDWDNATAIVEEATTLIGELAQAKEGEK